ANAKINLTLDILGTREDGYHEVEMILQSIELADNIELAKMDSGIKLEMDASAVSGGETLTVNENNLAYRAAKAVIDYCKLDNGIFIRLTKKIPIAAGLAGGSTDAAAVIRGMNQLFNLHLTTDELCEIGLKIGSDVPFCIIGGTCLASGRGEKLKRLPDLINVPVVLVKLRGAIPTAWAYKTYDSDRSSEHPDNLAICEAINLSDYEAVGELMFNVLEHVAAKKYPAILSYKEKMLEAGAIAAMMSGSGPTVFGIAKTQEDAVKIAESFKNSGTQVFVTKTIGRIEN
ncbi:MAG: 4-(cytidine 5'-diphospho)-2-C-methyl-D-erythritol kinase, partial [Selenomonadaceae bacterium]|nr:4-(cytidine 5'-diphospho)-2-C-methyl-D-erythritol kinase [Selenomonadaceae bacterium]